MGRSISKTFEAKRGTKKNYIQTLRASPGNLNSESKEAVKSRKQGKGALEQRGLVECVPANYTVVGTR